MSYYVWVSLKKTVGVGASTCPVSTEVMSMCVAQPPAGSQGRWVSGGTSTVWLCGINQSSLLHLSCFISTTAKHCHCHVTSSRESCVTEKSTLQRKT